MHAMRIIIFICSLIMPGLLWADYFTPPVTDKSIDLLGHLFGPTIGSVYLGGNANPALLHMFERFNAAIMVLGTLIVCYIAVISTINTAQEGQVMGRKWSSLWIPLRSLLGMLLLMPGPTSGYSIMQNVVIWLIMHGVGAADTLWNGMLDDLKNGMSPTQGITRPAQNTQAAKIYDALELIGADVAEAALRSTVCMNTIHKLANGSAKPPVGGFNTPKRNNVREMGNYVTTYETIHAHNHVTSEEAQFAGSLRIGIPNHKEFDHICGHYTITGSAKRSDWDQIQAKTLSQDALFSKAKEIYQHKVWALQLILQNFHGLANKIVDETVMPRDQNDRVTATPDQPLQPSGYRHMAINTYREILKQQIKPATINSVQNVVHAGKANGWVSAGSFYFTLNQIHPIEFYSDIMVPINIDAIPYCDNPQACSNYTPEMKNILTPQLHDFLQYGPEISYMGTRLWDAKVFLENDFTSIHDKLNLSPVGTSQSAPFFKLQHDMLLLLQEMMSEQHPDPLIAQGKFGSSIMSLSERAWLDTQNELETMINRATEGYSSITEAFKQKLQSLSQRGAIAVAIYSIVWIIGATLAIYIPLVPYIIFTVAVVGWFLLVIEAIVAAPILAISFMLPTGDEMGKMLQGLMLLLNIILRPVLMLFGFIFATRLYQAVVKLVNFGMLSNFDYLNTADSMFAWVAVLTIYATFVITLSNKSFSLIYALPDKVLRWMGAMPEQTDPSLELQTSKSTMLRGAETVNKVSTGIPERGFARSQSRAKELLHPPDAVRNN